MRALPAQWCLQRGSRKACSDLFIGPQGSPRRVCGPAVAGRFHKRLWERCGRRSEGCGKPVCGQSPWRRPAQREAHQPMRAHANGTRRRGRAQRRAHEPISSHEALGRIPFSACTIRFHPACPPRNHSFSAYSFSPSAGRTSFVQLHLSRSLSDVLFRRNPAERVRGHKAATAAAETSLPSPPACATPSLSPPPSGRRSRVHCLR